MGHSIHYSLTHFTYMCSCCKKMEREEVIGNISEFPINIIIIYTILHLFDRSIP